MVLDLDSYIAGTIITILAIFTMELVDCNAK